MKRVIVFLLMCVGVFGSENGGTFISATKSYQKMAIEDIRKLNLREENFVAWRGERINLQLLLWSKKEESKVSAKVSKLIGRNGSVISSNEINVDFLKYIEMNSHDGYAKDPKTVEKIAEMLDGASPVMINNHQPQALWIGVNIPRTAKAGNYSGKIEVKINDELLTFKYKVKVLDITLPEVKDWKFNLNLWTHPQAAAHYYCGCKSAGQNSSLYVHKDCDKFMWSDAHLAKYKANLVLLRDAGLKSITVNLVKDPWRSSYLLKPEQQQTNYSYDSMIKWSKNDNGEFIYDFKNFEKYVRFCMQLGIDKQIECFSMLPWCGNQFSAVIYYDKKSGKELVHNFASWEEYEKVWTNFIEQFCKVLVKNKWFEKTHIGVDERGLHNIVHVLKVLDKFKYNGKTLKLSTAANKEHSFDDKIAIISMHGGTSQLANDKWNNEKFKSYALDRRNKGLITTWYTCTGTYPGNFANSRPAESYFIGWYSAATGADGYLRWAVDSWNDDPMKSTDHKVYETGDTFQIYPGDRDSKRPFVRSSVRFELLRQGIVDFEKIQYLKEKFPKSREKIELLLASIKRPKMPERIKGNSSINYDASSENDFHNLLDAASKQLTEITLECISK